MSSVKIYTAVSEDLSPLIHGEGFCTDMVRYSDYAALEAKCAALAAEVQAVRWACGQVYMKGYNHGHLNTVDGLDYASDTELVQRGGEALADFTDPDRCGVAADAILAEVRAQAHKEGAHFVANRMLAAWEAGFIEDTAKNAADIARMILTSTEFMPNAPEGDFDRSFADGVLEDIAAQLRQEAAQ
ncbi:ead/Ea22-like family protein [Leclercia sp. H6W5]|uniref:ead/Ea22-like family protein n=1 Tax=Leclercia tamurae TaxID=2926467 RepID=UPI0021CFDB95|nr:ead/Ea22-like family protein [Leclercia tamurae]MCU6683318.1 ead/Ea22-like family protein [Leclercia tamurae]